MKEQIETDIINTICIYEREKLYDKDQFLNIFFNLLFF